MPKNPNHRRGSTVKHQGKHVRVDAEGYQLRDEDREWVKSMGGKVEADDGDVLLVYPSRKAAQAAFAGMAREGKCNVDSVRGMVFVSEDTAELAASLQGLTD